MTQLFHCNFEIGLCEWFVCRLQAIASSLSDNRNPQCVIDICIFHTKTMTFLKTKTSNCGLAIKMHLLASQLIFFTRSFRTTNDSLIIIQFFFCIKNQLKFHQLFCAKFTTTKCTQNSLNAINNQNQFPQW